MKETVNLSSSWFLGTVSTAMTEVTVKEKSRGRTGTLENLFLMSSGQAGLRQRTILSDKARTRSAVDFLGLIFH